MGVMDYFKAGKIKSGVSSATKNVEQDLLKFESKDTINVNDVILDHYSRENGIDDIQQEILKKYLKNAQDIVIQKEMMDNNILEESVEELGKTGDIDEKQKKDVKEELKKEKGKEELSKGDKKKALQEKVYKTAYKCMYEDYAKHVVDEKAFQLEKTAAAMDPKGAIKTLAYEKSLEKLELSYNRVNNKKILDNKDIKEKQKDLENNFERKENAIEGKVQDNLQDIDRLYKIRQQKYREYIDALCDKSKTPGQIKAYKEDFEKANLDLINNSPSLSEHVKQLDKNDEIKKYARSKGVEISAINTDMERKEKYVTDINDTRVEKVESKESTRESMREYETDRTIQNNMRDGNYKEASNVAGAHTQIGRYDNDIDNTEKNVKPSEAQEHVQEQEESESKQRSGLNDYLKKYTLNINNPKDVEKLREIEEKNAQNEIAVQQEEYVRKRKNSNHHNN